ncbi:MAG: IS1634 family transposase [Candidatus Parcubacteria bacterium]|nr:IS1634 family transposase [Candidatus Parcubacteria bacterium]
MASLQRIKVRGTYYYSIVECRRINGKPTPVNIAYLGNIENILNVFNNKNSTAGNVSYKSYSYGAVFALWKIAQKHHITKFLDKAFPEQTRNGMSRGQTLLIASIYRAIYPGSKSGFSEWISTTSLPAIAKFDPENMTSQHFWDQMDGINENMLYNAEDAIAQHILKHYNIQPSKLALDYTNYFTYIDTYNEKCTIAKRGHNKQKRDDLRQFSLGLVTTKELAIPLCSYVYDGNMNDVTAFPEYLKLLKKRIVNYTDVKDITLVYDNGSVSRKNLAELKDTDFDIHYVCAFSTSSCKELLNISIKDYIKVSIYKDKEILCYRTVRKIWGEDRVCVLIYSEDLYKGQYKELIKSIGKKETLLQELKEQINNAKSKISKKAADINVKINKIINGDFGKEIFVVNKTGADVIDNIEFSVKYNVVEELCNKHYGKKVIITDQLPWETKEILEAYWDQNSIEGIFKDSKNTQHFSVRPQFHWTDSKVRVHTFCCLIGLLLTSLLKKELADAGIKMENKKIIDELSGIREVYLLAPDKKAKNGFTVDKKLEQMSKTQSDIWKALEKTVLNSNK